jgi:serine/threonine protein kinase
MQGGLFFKSIAHPVSESFVGMVMFNLLSALEYLHAHNIMHRDIKPANLMLKSPEEPTEICLVDLGVADHYNPAGEYLFVRCGTPGYLAPEILLD